ncbi:MAG: type II TA system antitoxin MqsA family protein [Desulfitobacteriaceae bacterium]
MEKYCHVCECNRVVNMVTKKESFPVKGEPIEVVSDILTCSLCGEEIFDPYLDETNLERAFSDYRNKHNLLSPAQICQLRRQFGSGRLVATLLGWSQATLVRYENGAIPEKAHHEQLLRLKEDPKYIKTLFEKSSDKLSERERGKLSLIIEDKKSSAAFIDPVEQLNLYFRQFYDNGQLITEFDYMKLTNVVLFYAYYHPILYKTKLQKLLFYTDFLSTKRYGKQIIGLPFVHHNYGPVPLNHDLVHACLVMTETIETKLTAAPYEGEVIVASQEPDMAIFLPEEIDVLQSVLGFFRSYSSTQISDFSHKEKGYIETNHKEIIPYDYANYLLID